MMQGVIKDAVKDSAKRGTTFDTTQYKWVQEDIEKLPTDHKSCIPTYFCNKSN